MSDDNLQNVFNQLKNECDKIEFFTLQKKLQINELALLGNNDCWTEFTSCLQQESPDEINFEEFKLAMRDQKIKGYQKINVQVLQEEESKE